MQIDFTSISCLVIPLLLLGSTGKLIGLGIGSADNVEKETGPQVPFRTHPRKSVAFYRTLTVARSLKLFYATVAAPYAFRGNMDVPLWQLLSSHSNGNIYTFLDQIIHCIHKNTGSHICLLVAEHTESGFANRQM